MNRRKQTHRLLRIQNHGPSQTQSIHETDLFADQAAWLKRGHLSGRHSCRPASPSAPPSSARLRELQGGGVVHHGEALPCQGSPETRGTERVDRPGAGRPLRPKTSDRLKTNPSFSRLSSRSSGAQRPASGHPKSNQQRLKDPIGYPIANPIGS